MFCLHSSWMLYHMHACLVPVKLEAELQMVVSLLVRAENRTLLVPYKSNKCSSETSFYNPPPSIQPSLQKVYKQTKNNKIWDFPPQCWEAEDDVSSQPGLHSKF